MARQRRRSQAYEAERRPATTDLVMLNRRNGPEQVMQMVEERAPRRLCGRHRRAVAAGTGRHRGELQARRRLPGRRPQRQAADRARRRRAGKPPGSGVSSAQPVRDHLAHDVGQRLVLQCRNRHPAHALRRAAARRNIRGVDHQLQREMREHVGDDAEPCDASAPRLERRRLLAAPPCRPGRPASPSVGTSVMPPSRPFSARVRTSNSSPRVTTNAAPRRSSPVFFGALRGKVS